MKARYFFLSLFCILSFNAPAAEIPADKLIYATLINPVKFKNSPTSKTQIIASFGKALDFNQDDIDAMTSCVLKIDPEAVSAWIGERDSALIETDLATCKEVLAISLNSKSRSRTVPIFTNTRLYQQFSIMVDACINYNTSVSERVEQALPPELFELLAKGYAGSILTDDELNKLQDWTVSKSKDTLNLMVNGPAISNCNILLLSQLPQPLLFRYLDLQKDWLPSVRILGLVTTKKGPTSLVYNLIKEGFESNQLELQQCIDFLSIWGETSMSQSLAHQFLIDKSLHLTSGQRAELYYLLRNNKTGYRQEIIDELALYNKAIGLNQ